MTREYTDEVEANAHINIMKKPTINTMKKTAALIAFAMTFAFAAQAQAAITITPLCTDAPATTLNWQLQNTDQGLNNLVAWDRSNGTETGGVTVLAGSLKLLVTGSSNASDTLQVIDNAGATTTADADYDACTPPPAPAPDPNATTTDPVVAAATPEAPAPVIMYGGHSGSYSVSYLTAQATSPLELQLIGLMTQIIELLKQELALLQLQGR